MSLLFSLRSFSSSCDTNSAGTELLCVISFNSFSNKAISFSCQNNNKSRYTDQSIKQASASFRLLHQTVYRVLYRVLLEISGRILPDTVCVRVYFLAKLITLEKRKLYNQAMSEIDGKCTQYTFWSGVSEKHWQLSKVVYYQQVNCSMTHTREDDQKNTQNMTVLFRVSVLQEKSSLKHAAPGCLDHQNLRCLDVLISKSIQYYEQRKHFGTPNYMDV